MVQNAGEARGGLRAELQALRERVAELEAAAVEREQRMEAVYLQAFESEAALMALSTFEEGRFIEVNDAFLERAPRARILRDGQLDTFSDHYPVECVWEQSF